MAQVAGSAVAAVAAAVAASQLGVYGTILGAGVMSVVATTGGSVFQHLFRRTGEQIREVAVQAKEHGVPVTRDGEPVPPTFLAHPEAVAEAVEAAADDQSPHLPPSAGGRAVPARDAEPTRALPAVSPDDLATRMIPALTPEDLATRLIRTRAEAGTESAARPAHDEGGSGGEDDATRLLPQAPGTADTTGLPRADTGGADAGGADTGRGTETDTRRATEGAGAGASDEATRLLRVPAPGAAPGSLPTQRLPAGLSEEFGEAVTHRAKMRRWRRPLITAAVVFGVSMTGITGYEVLAGHSLSGGNGPTISRLGGNSGTHHEGPAQPGTDPSQDEAPGSDPSGSGSGTSSPGQSESPSPGGSGTGDGQQDKGSDKDNDTDKGQDSGDRGSADKDTGSSPGQGDSTSPAEPTPTPTPSDPGQSGDGSGTGTGQDDGGQGQEQDVAPQQDGSPAP